MLCVGCSSKGLVPQFHLFCVTYLTLVLQPCLLHMFHCLLSCLCRWCCGWIPQTCQPAANCGLIFRWATQQEPPGGNGGHICVGRWYVWLFYACRGTWVKFGISSVLLTWCAYDSGDKGHGQWMLQPCVLICRCSARQWWAVRWL